MGTSDVYLQRWARPAVNIYVHTYYWHTIGNLKVITSPSSNSKLIEILLNWSLCLCQYPPIQDLKMLTDSLYEFIWNARPGAKSSGLGTRVQMRFTYHTSKYLKVVGK